MSPFPQYDEDGEEILFFPNIWRNIDPQPLLGVDCFLPFAELNNLQNRFVWEGSGVEFRQILSALYLGAEIAYPESFMQVLANFLRMVHCPIDFEEECQEFPPYAGLISYPLQNPFSNPDFIPDGYVTPPFILVDGGNIGEFPQNEIGDIVVPASAITLDVNWFEDISGQLPTILVKVQGSGKASIRLLNQALGGLAVVTVDNPPNLADIIVGIVTGADNIIDLNLDLISLPPETAVEHVFPVDVVGEGLHTIYIVFLPILDDSFIPIRFGGGFRGVELCDFGELPDMGITNLRVVPNVVDGRYDLEKQILGDWSLVDGWVSFFDDYLEFTRERALHADAVAVGLHDVEDWGEPYPNDGFVGSPLQDYIDNAATPFDPSELEAAIAAAQATADTALESASDATAVNIDQNVILNDHEERISNLEQDIAGLVNTVWVQEFDFVSGGELDWSGVTFVEGEGFLFTNVDTEIIYSPTITATDRRITHVELETLGVSGTTFIFPVAEYPIGSNGQEIRISGGGGLISTSWMQIGEIPLGAVPSLGLALPGFGSFYLRRIAIWGRGTNPF